MDVVIVTSNDLQGKTPRDYADDYYDYNGYGNKDWLYISNTIQYTIQWLMSPYSGNSSYVFRVHWSGIADGAIRGSIAFTNAVSPVFYLTSTTSIDGGDGSLNNPYLLSVQ